MESLLIATLLIVGWALVFAGALGLPSMSRPLSGVLQVIDHGRGFVSSVRLPRTRRRHTISPTDVILAELLTEMAELRREIAGLRSPRS